MLDLVFWIAFVALLGLGIAPCSLDMGQRYAASHST
jgi:hypothetical protein